MKHLVNVSGGNGSGMALLRVIDRYGRENVSAVFADTNSEHADLYRFLADLEAAAGIKIVRLDNGGATIWDTFFRRYMFTNPHGGCVASEDLKKKPLIRFRETVGTPETLTVHVGFSIDEDDRMARLRKADAQWQFDFPLTWPKAMLRCDIENELKRRGVRPCEVYEKGYPHSNCLRWNCILAGIGQWIGVLNDNPAGYAEAEEHEQRFMAELERRGRAPQTILRDRRGGTTKNLSLRQLREEVESGVRRRVPEWRESTCTCVGDLFQGDGQ